MKIRPFAAIRFIGVSLTMSIGISILSSGGKISPLREVSVLKSIICLGIGLLAGLITNACVQLWYESKALKYYYVYLHTQDIAMRRDARRRYLEYYERLSNANQRVFHEKSRCFF